MPLPEETLQQIEKKLRIQFPPIARQVFSAHYHPGAYHQLIPPVPYDSHQQLLTFSTDSEDQQGIIYQTLQFRKRWGSKSKMVVLTETNEGYYARLYLKVSPTQPDQLGEALFFGGDPVAYPHEIKISNSLAECVVLHTFPLSWLQAQQLERATGIQPPKDLLNLILRMKEFTTFKNPFYEFLPTVDSIIERSKSILKEGYQLNNIQPGYNRSDEFLPVEKAIIFASHASGDSLGFTPHAGKLSFNWPDLRVYEFVHQKKQVFWFK